MINFLKKIKTFGFGKNPVSHWFWQRITAVLMIVIFCWLIFVFQNLLNNFQENFYIWIKNPLNLILFIILIILVMHHSLLGILNIFEDNVLVQLQKGLLLCTYIRLHLGHLTNQIL